MLSSFSQHSRLSIVHTTEVAQIVSIPNLLGGLWLPEFRQMWDLVLLIIWNCGVREDASEMGVCPTKWHLDLQCHWEWQSLSWFLNGLWTQKLRAECALSHKTFTDSVVFGFLSQNLKNEVHGSWRMRCRKKNFAIEYYVLKSMKEGRAPMQHKGSSGVGTTKDHCLDINRALLANMKPFMWTSWSVQFPLQVSRCPAGIVTSSVWLPGKGWSFRGEKKIGKEKKKTSPLNPSLWLAQDLESFRHFYPL